MKTITRLVSIIFIFSMIVGCSPKEEPVAKPPENPEIILATTTSTRDSGLLDEILPIFQEQTGYNVKMVAVGTGQALAMGEEGNADVLLVHAPAAEKELMDKGFGLERLLIMHNDFVIVGPADDPAGIKSIAKTTDAMVAIANLGAPFVSRGDDSGTNKMEISLWGKTDIEPVSDWYIQTGQGMGDTLRVASEKFAYTITDRASYLALKDTLEFEILLEGDAVLLNIYHVIVINPDKWPKTNVAGAQAIAQFLVSNEIQEFIKDYGVEQYGQPLFFPDAGKDEASLGM